MDYTNLDQQIKDVELSIEHGNERVRSLKAHLWPATKALMKRNRTPVLIGLGVVAISVLVLYPRRHQVLRSVRKLSTHPVVKMLLVRMPMAGAIWPLLQGGSIRKGLLSKAFLWLTQRMSHGSESQNKRRSTSR